MGSTLAGPAGVWVRVSTGGQDEQDQVPSIEKHCDEHGYRVIRKYELNDRSASKGEQQAKLDEMLEDVREGTIRVLVCWRSNRLERRGPEAVFRLKRLVTDAGGRIEVTTEPYFGALDISGEAMTALNAVIDSQFSIKLSEDTARSLRAIKASGHVYNGSAPWGFSIEGPKKGKRLVPTDLGREVIPEIFNRCIAGDSLRTIAHWLDSHGVPTKRGGKWNEGCVRKIVRNRVYAGTVLDGNGNTVIELPESDWLVRPSVFDRANEALRNHPKRGPAQNPPLLAKLRCARCGSPMYRRKEHKNSIIEYYRCFGSGAQRKGCGNLVPMWAANTIIAAAAFKNEPYKIRTWIEGDRYDDKISNAKQKLREAVEGERWAEIPELTASVDYWREKQEHATKGHYESTYRLRDGTPISEGDHDYYQRRGLLLLVGEYFDTLDLNGQREYLKGYDIRVEKVSTPEGLPLEPGATRGMRVVIDGTERGVWPYPPTGDIRRMLAKMAATA